MVGYTPRSRGITTFPVACRRGWAVPAVEEQLRTFLCHSHLAEEAIRNDHPGSTRPTYLSWVDIAPGHRASGRYLIAVNETGTDSVILPAGVDTIASELRRRTQATPAASSRTARFHRHDTVRRRSGAIR